MQLRQRSVANGAATLLRGAARAIERRTAVSLCLLQHDEQPGLPELEALHTILAQSISRLRAVFGGVLRERCKEATMFEGLRKAPVDVAAMSGALLGG